MNNELTIRTDAEALSEIEKTYTVIKVTDSQKAEADKKIRTLLNKSKEVKELKHGFWRGKSVTISALQEIAVEQAKIISDMWDAHKMTFEYLSDMSVAMRKLFLIGVANSAYTRAIISNLRQKTEIDNLTEDARNELLGVIRDLEAQADAHDKIQRLKNRVNELQESCNDTSSQLIHAKDDIFNRIASLSDLCESISRTLNSIQEQAQSDHDKIFLLSQWSDSIEEQIDKLSEICVYNDRFDELTNEVYLSNNRISSKLSSLEVAIEEHSKTISQFNAAIVIIQTKLKKQKYYVIIANIMAVIAILFAIFI